ncbi:cytochrome P450 [Kitasatospora sp. NPDC057015]|uniref:cytochrome P450 n=1 Tax=Kitasatospora sp. NPDC057015 TaxID=3346001 RepID=UPI00362CF29F
MPTTEHVFTRHAEVGTALADPHLVPLPARSGPPGSTAWLRATVARFSAGDVHARRRALVEAELARLDPATLRTAAAAATGPDARLRVVGVLAAALGVAEPEAVARAVVVVAGAYFGSAAPGAGPGAGPAHASSDDAADEADEAEADDAADAAVAWLLPRLLPDPPAPGGAPDPDEAALEAAANRIGLLVQACDATATLVEHTRRAVADRPGSHSPEALLVETLRHDPPVRALRRVAVRGTRVAGVEIAAGDVVLLDVAAANRDPEVFTDPDVFTPDRAPAAGPAALTFGAAPRLCPGHRHALALAAGVLTAGVLAAGVLDGATRDGDDRPTTP